LPPTILDVEFDPISGAQEYQKRRPVEWGELVWLDALVLNGAEPVEKFPQRPV
jgi:hypothetical protein